MEKTTDEVIGRYHLTQMDNRLVIHESIRPLARSAMIGGGLISAATPFLYLAGLPGPVLFFTMVIGLAAIYWGYIRWEMPQHMELSANGISLPRAKLNYPVKQINHIRVVRKDVRNFVVIVTRNNLTKIAPLWFYRRADAQRFADVISQYMTVPVEKSIAT